MLFTDPGEQPAPESDLSPPHIWLLALPARVCGHTSMLLLLLLFLLLGGGTYPVFPGQLGQQSAALLGQLVGLLSATRGGGDCEHWRGPGKQALCSVCSCPQAALCQ